MIKLRDCVLKLPENHAVKRWMKWIANPKFVDKKSQEKINFLSETVSSQFNLITDLNIRNKIIHTLLEIPSNTLPEQLLRSYLYLIIGNVTRSDNILKEIINTPPRVNWEKTGLHASIYHKFSINQIKQIINKLVRHPAERNIFRLLILYIEHYYNDEGLIALLDSIDTSDLEMKMELKYIESISPSLIHYLNLIKMKESKRITSLRDLAKYNLDQQSYWFWPFMDIDPFISETLTPELIRLEQHDELWFIYILGNEKLSDLFSKKNGKIFLPNRRSFLKEGLHESKTFMMSLFKLIELGDINQGLVELTINQLTHE